MVMSAFAVTSTVLGFAACAWATPSSAGPGITALKQSALTYARATLSGGFTELEATLSHECRSTEHITPQNLPLARAAWGHQIGVSFSTIRITGVRVRDVTKTSAQGEVHYNTPKAGNNNWVTFVVNSGHWKVGGQCAVPIGNSEQSSP
jgi:hypothetical protein